MQACQATGIQDEKVQILDVFTSLLEDGCRARLL